jgi:hypothetical protein
MSEPNMPVPSACPPHVLHGRTKHICGSSTNKFAKNGKVPNGNGPLVARISLKEIQQTI